MMRDPLSQSTILGLFSMVGDKIHYPNQTIIVISAQLSNKVTSIRYMSKSPIGKRQFFVAENQQVVIVG